MKKNLFKFITLILVLCALCFVYSACVDESTSDECFHNCVSYVNSEEPTCIEGGLCSLVCLDCGEVIETDYVSPKGHTLGEWEQIEATCVDEGEKFRKCVDCGHVMISEKTKATQLHKYIEGKCEICGIDDLIYTINDDGETYSVTGYNRNVKGAVAILDKYNGKPVVCVKEAALKYCELTSIKISSNIRTISKDAFWGCKSLSNVIFESNSELKVIEDHAFFLCEALTTLELPNTVTSIGRQAFFSTSIKTAKIPAWASRYIGEHIANRVLESVVITSGEKIPIWAFEGCSSLKEVSILSNLTSIDKGAFSDCVELTSIEIPSSVTSIGKDAFLECDLLVKVDYFGTIDQWAEIDFTTSSSNPLGSGAGLYINDKLVEEIEIKKATRINSYAFYNYKSLKSLNMGENVRYIGMCAFANTGLKSVDIPNTVTNIGQCAFSQCNSLESITIPFVGASETANNGYDQVLGYIFGWTKSSYGADISGTTCQYINSSDFYLYYIPASLKTVKINGGTEIPTNAFMNCTGLTSIELFNDTSIIGKCAFENCVGLTSIEIPDGVTVIGEEAFRDCTKLTSIKIPNNATVIGRGAFAACESLETITIPSACGALFDGEGLLFSNIFYDRKDSAGGHCSLKKVVVTGGESVEDKAFYGCSYLSEIELPNTIKSIGEYAFYRCSGLTSITIPNSVENIGWYAFSNCTGLTSITIPDSVKTIGGGAFEYCDRLKNVTVDAETIEISFGVFEGCVLLSSVVFNKIDYCLVRISQSSNKGYRIDVSDPTKNASNLTGQYCNYFWSQYW